LPTSLHHGTSFRLRVAGMRYFSYDATKVSILADFALGVATASSAQGSPRRARSLTARV
jgi:hypothetical protein